MLSKINAFSVKYLISYYFLLSGLDGVFLMFGMLSLTKVNMVIAIMSIFITTEKLLFRRQGIDWFIALFILVIILSSSVLSYNPILFHFGLRYQLLLMFFFWVGESRYMTDWSLFEKAKLPMVIIALIGLLLFFFPPGWYISYKFANRDLGTNSFFLEMTRLSAFWPYPYWISYGCAILYYYVLCRLYSLGRAAKKSEVFFLGFMLLTLVLSQQRAPLGFVLLATVVFFLISLGGKSIKMKILRNRMVLLLLIIVAAIFLLVSFLDTERLDFMLDKVIALNRGDNESFVAKRFELFTGISNMEPTLFGQGIGRYSHAALSLNKPAITDNQYLAIYYEIGYLGCIGYALIFGAVLIRGLKNYKYCIFELGIVFFYLIAMTGANPLSVAEEHTIIFWICCGRIFNKQCLQYKKEELRCFN